MVIQKDKCNSCFEKTCSSEQKNYVYKTINGISEQIIKQISMQKEEPSWMLDLRLKAYVYFKSKPLPEWGPNLNQLNLDDICFYLKTVKEEHSWQSLPTSVRNEFDQIGVSAQLTDNSFGGVGVQYESEIIYHNLRKEWESLGVIFLSTDAALKKYPELFKEYFGTVVPFDDNKFAALNSAVWSGGSFIYVPRGVKIQIPLQTYYKISSESMGQFERTLIIADENSSVSFIEGCTASAYSSNALHSAVVEIIAKEGAAVRYYTVQNWSKNVYNLVTKRALAKKNAVVEWIDSNIGSGITMKYPAIILDGDGAKAEVFSLAFASSDKQIQDSGAKVIHKKENTSSKIVSRSISSNGGKASFRGYIKVENNAKNCKSFVQCDSLIMDDKSQADAYPYIDIENKDVNIGHEARISKLDDEKIYYLMSRGIGFNEAQSLIVNGFVQNVMKELPMEYAIEISRLIDMEIR